MADADSSFMNALLGGEVREDESLATKRESIGGRSDGGAGQDRDLAGAPDMTAWLREAVQESRGRAS